MQGQWNSLNLNFKKLSNYHKGKGNHTSFQDFSFENKERFHLPHQLNKKYYEVIEAFMGEKTIIIPLNNKDVSDEKDKIYNTLAHKK